MTSNIHAKVYRAQFLNTLIDCPFDTVCIPHINRSNAKDPRTLPCCHERSGHSFRLFGIAAHDASIRPEMNQSSHLSAADCAIPTSAEDDFVRYTLLIGGSPDSSNSAQLTENPIFPNVTQISCFLKGH